jgi:protoheme IX farnesyltransferase
MASVEPVGSPSGRDYFVLTKPWISLLIVAVAIAGYFVAQPRVLNAERLGSLVVLGFLASAGAATLNHFFDRDVDGRMRRTRGRPLPSGRIVSPRRVLAIGGGLSAVGIGGAAIALNPLTALSIFLGWLTYVVVYTVWLKRRTPWNIVIGGFAGSAPALAGSAAAVGSWTPAALALALLVFLWTPPHFWSLALLLRDDYRRAGLPMLPRMDDPTYSARMTVLSAALLLPATALLIVVGPIAGPTLVVLWASGIGFLLASLPLVWSPERRAALRGFVVSGPYLLVVVGAVIANWALVRLGP